MSEQKVSRRSFLKYAGAAVAVVAVVGGGAYYYYQSTQPRYKGMTVRASWQEFDATLVFAKLLDQFESETGIHVEVSFFPEIELFEKQLIELSSHSVQHEVVTTFCDTMVQYSKAGWILPLNQFINNTSLTDPKEFDVNDIFPRYLGILTDEKGTIWSLPFYGESTMVYYRKDLFEEHGVSSPEKGYTMEEFWDAAAKLTLDTNEDGRTDLWGVALRGKRGFSMNVYPFSGFFKAFGGQWFIDDVPAFNTPEGVEALTFYSEILQKYAPPGAETFLWDDVQIAFQQGTVAMIIDATDFGPRLEDPSASVAAGKVGYAPVPEGRNGRWPSIWAAGLCINAFASKESQEASWLFMQWCMSKKMQLRASLDGLHSNVMRKSVMDDPQYRAKYKSEWIEMAQKMESIANPTEYRPIHYPEWPEIGDRLGQAIEEAIAKVKTPKQALDDAYTDVYAIMKKAGYYG